MTIIMIRNFTSVTKLYDIDNNVETYVVVENGITSFVPLDPANTDYIAIQEWIKEGNTPLPADNSPEEPTE